MISITMWWRYKTRLFECERDFWRPAWEVVISDPVKSNYPVSKPRKRRAS